MDLNALNPEQRRAAETLEGPVLIQASSAFSSPISCCTRVFISFAALFVKVSARMFQAGTP